MRVADAAASGGSVGRKNGRGKIRGPEFTKTCTWTAPVLIVTLMLKDLEMFQAGKKAPARSEVMSTGVGDDAYYLAVGNQIGLQVKKGGAAFKVTVYSKSLPKETNEKAEKSSRRKSSPNSSCYRISR